MGNNNSSQKTNKMFVKSNFLKTKTDVKEQIKEQKKKGKKISCDNLAFNVPNEILEDLSNFKLDDKGTGKNKTATKFEAENSQTSKKLYDSNNKINKDVAKTIKSRLSEPNVLTNSQNIINPSHSKAKYNSIMELPIIIEDEIINSKLDGKYEKDKYKNLNKKYNDLNQENESEEFNYHESGRVKVDSKSSSEVISISTMNDLSKFNLIKVIGKGTFGKVILVTLKDNPNYLFALKVLKKDHIVTTKNVKNIINERKLLSEIDNNFVVNLRFTFQSKDKLFMAFDYHNGGELFYHLQKKKRFTEDEVKIYAAEIYIGLTYLHSKMILYRDIKPENIILDKNGHIKFVDFGLAKKLSQNNLFTKSFCGTNEYIRNFLI